MALYGSIYVLPDTFGWLVFRLTRDTARGVEPVDVDFHARGLASDFRDREWSV